MGSLCEGDDEGGAPHGSSVLVKGGPRELQSLPPGEDTERILSMNQEADPWQTLSLLDP